MRIVKYPDASIGVFDPRGSRQMDMPACPLGSLLAGIKKSRSTISFKWIPQAPGLLFLLLISVLLP